MKLKNLLYLLLAAPLFVACDPVEEQLDPVLTLTSETEMTFTAEGGQGVITYTLENPAEGTKLEASCEAAWVLGLTTGETVTFGVVANEGDARETKVVVKYGEQSFEVAVKQAAPEAKPEPEPEKPVLTETVTLTLDASSVTWRAASVNVEVSKEGMGFVLYLLPKAEWNEKYAADPQKIVEDRVAGWKNDVETQISNYPNLDTWQKWMKLYQKKGSQVVAIEEIRVLRWAEEYVVYCFGMDEDGTQTSEVATVEFSTTTPEASDNQISVTINSTTTSSVEFTVNATNDDPYYVTIQQIAYVDRWNESTYEDMVFDLLETLTDYQIENRIFTGTQSLDNTSVGSSVNGFKEYKVVVWGFDGGPTTTPIFSETFKPGTTHQEPAEPEEAFTVEISDETWCDATVVVTPNEEDLVYVVGGMTKAAYDEAGYEANPTAIYEKDKAGWESSAEYYDGSTWLDMMKYDTLKGTLETTATELFGASRLRWATDYVLYFYGVDASGNMTTDVQIAELSTVTPTPSDNTFEITIDAMTKTSVNVTVTPSNPEDQYYVTVQKANVIAPYGPDKDKSYDDMIAALIPDADFTLESRLFTGTQSLTNSSVGATVSGFYEYQIVVWGFDGGPTTTATISAAFKPTNQ